MGLEKLAPTELQGRAWGGRESIPYKGKTVQSKLYLVHCILQLYTVYNSCTLYIIAVHCILHLYTLYYICTLYNMAVHCIIQLYTVYNSCTLYTTAVHCILQLYTVRQKLYTVHHTLYTAILKPYFAHCMLYKV